MLIGEEIEQSEVQKCWILHEYETRGKNIGSKAIQAIKREDWQAALFLRIEKAMLMEYSKT